MPTPIQPSDPTQPSHPGPVPASDLTPPTSRPPPTHAPGRQDTRLPLAGQRHPEGAPLAARPHPLRPDGAVDPSASVGSLYIHVPFCFHKCHYCDFYSIVDTRDRQAPFTDRLERELAALAPHAARPLNTIFVGGGTPSLLRPDLWRRLLGTLDRLFDLSRIRAGAGEFTVECNPETVTAELMDVFAAGGVGRVSLGAQTFDHRHLKTLERWHDPVNVERAVALARCAGIGRQSVDLIFGIPGQTVGEWREDLRRAVALGTEHVSCYNLTYEPGTAMTARLERGEFRPAEEDAEIEMFAVTRDELAEAGLHRYEISNFARPGAECRHNLVYWRQGEWLAAGPSASGHVAGHRWKNAPRLDDYLTGDDAGLPPLADHERPDARRAIIERVMTGLRLAEGIDGSTLAAESEGLWPGAASRVGRELDRLEAEDLIVRAAGRVRITESGVLLANRVVLRVVEAMEGP